MSIPTHWTAYCIKFIFFKKAYFWTLSIFVYRQITYKGQCLQHRRVQFFESFGVGMQQQTSRKGFRHRLISWHRMSPFKCKQRSILFVILSKRLAGRTCMPQQGALTSGWKIHSFWFLVGVSLPIYEWVLGWTGQWAGRAQITSFLSKHGSKSRKTENHSWQNKHTCAYTPRVCKQTWNENHINIL